MSIVFGWRDEVPDGELARLHAEGFGEPAHAAAWRARLHRHSLGWVTAHDGGELVGFVNVAWDGGAHAFLLDTVVAPTVQRGGIGTELVSIAVGRAREAGCTWLHVDGEPAVWPFYEACGFAATDAGVIDLR